MPWGCLPSSIMRKNKVFRDLNGIMKRNFFFMAVDLIQNFVDPKKSTNKMSSVMPLTFNAVELCVRTIKEKPWTRAREMCKALKWCKVMFPHVRRQLTNEMKEDDQLAIEEIQEKHQQAIEEKDAALALLTDDLKDHDNRIQAIQYENVPLQAQRNVYQAQLQRCEDIITHLMTR